MILYCHRSLKESGSEVSMKATRSSSDNSISTPLLLSEHLRNVYVYLLYHERDNASTYVTDMKVL